MPAPSGASAAFAHLGKLAAGLTLTKVGLAAAVVVGVVGIGYFFFKRSNAIAYHNNEDKSKDKPSTPPEQIKKPNSSLRQRKPDPNIQVEKWTPNRPQRIIDDMTVDFLDLFHCTQSLGSGPFGRVYDSIDLTTDRRVAVKIMQKRNPDVTWKTHLKEVKDLNSLEHKNIIKHHLIVDIETSIAIEMPKYPECNLKNVIQMNQRMGRQFPHENVRKWMANLSSALAYVHSQNVLHKDLKLTNILLSAHNNDLVIADFALSKVWDIEHARSVPESRNFLAPGATNQNYHAKDDVYSLGCVFICMLAMVTNPERTPEAWRKVTNFGTRYFGILYSCVAVKVESRPTAEQLNLQIQNNS